MRDLDHLLAWLRGVAADGVPYGHSSTQQGSGFGEINALRDLLSQSGQSPYPLCKASPLTTHDRGDYVRAHILQGNASSHHGLETLGHALLLQDLLLTVL